MMRRESSLTPMRPVAADSSVTTTPLWPFSSCVFSPTRAYYSPRVCGIMDRQIQEALARRVAERQEKQRLKKEELKTSLARGVATWSLADLKADCKLLDLPVSGNKGQLFNRLQGYVDGTVRPKKKRRR